MRLPRLDRGGRERTVGSMFVFGVSYAIASIGCTLPLFLGAVAGTISATRCSTACWSSPCTALGMTLVLLALTVAMALARTSIVRLLRRAQPYVGRVAGGLRGAGGRVRRLLRLARGPAAGASGVVPDSDITDVVAGGPPT